MLRDQAIVDLVHAALSPLNQARGGAAPLLATLEAYFDTGGVATESAKRLHVSVRTVSYRLHRVKALTGYNPFRPAHRFALQAAVLGAKVDLAAGVATHAQLNQFHPGAGKTCRLIDPYQFGGDRFKERLPSHSSTMSSMVITGSVTVGGAPRSSTGLHRPWGQRWSRSPGHQPRSAVLPSPRCLRWRQQHHHHQNRSEVSELGRLVLPVSVIARRAMMIVGLFPRGAGDHAARRAGAQCACTH